MYDDYATAAEGAGGPITVIAMLISLALTVFLTVCLWKIYVKAGEKGWATLIPFYNNYVLFKIVWGNGWLFFLTMIPFVGFVFNVLALFKLAKSFGKGAGFGFGLWFLGPVFLPMLAFGSARYLGPDGGMQNNGWQQPQGNGWQQPQGNGWQQPQGNGWQQPQDNNWQQPADSQQPVLQQPAPKPDVRCPNCGQRLDDNVTFCPVCGTKVK